MGKLLTRFFRAARNEDGLAAIEFAFIAPVLVTMFIGTVEVTDALTCRSKVTTLASTAADLVAQDDDISNTEMTNIFNTLNSVLFPYSTTTVKIRITSIIENGSGGYKVAWSDGYNMTANTVGAAMTVPSGVVASGGSVIKTEVTYTYSSSTAKLITGGLTMTDTFYARPRKVAIITRST
jgi:Flp pilus assembly protein TadG